MLIPQERRHHLGISLAKPRRIHCNGVCVLAGYQKIHLDASMRCADDPKIQLDTEVVAERAAVLAEAAERAFRELPPGSDPPVYVIGTEVPAPGGETEPGTPPTVTKSDYVLHTWETFRSAFA